MELKIGQWYLDTPARSWMNHTLVKVTGFRFNVVEFEDEREWDGEMSVPEFTRAFTREVERRPEGPVTLPAEYSGYYVADLCECCFIALVNGEPCDCEGDAEDERYPQHPSGLMELLGSEDVTPGLFAEKHDSRCLTYLLDATDVPGDYECECEHDEYSTVQCDGCGSFLHGKRHKVTGWILRKGE